MKTWKSSTAVPASIRSAAAGVLPADCSSTEFRPRAMSLTVSTSAGAEVEVEEAKVEEAKVEEAKVEISPSAAPGIQLTRRQQRWMRQAKSERSHSAVASAAVGLVAGHRTEMDFRIPCSGVVLIFGVYFCDVWPGTFLCVFVFVTGLRRALKHT